MLLACTSCKGMKDETNATEINHFTPLGNDMTLYVGANGVFTNYEIENKTEEYLSYLSSVTYTLRRSSYRYSEEIPYVEYDGYYYYWETDNIYEEIMLGEKTVKNTYEYAYMPYGEKNNINVRLTRTTETTYDYEGGFISKDFDYTVDVGYYFDSWNELRMLCPELAKRINTTGTKKYYVDVTTPTSISYNTESFTETYYYFENNVTEE
jgi:hypothetical protein